MTETPIPNLSTGPWGGGGGGGGGGGFHLLGCHQLLVGLHYTDGKGSGLQLYYSTD